MALSGPRLASFIDLLGYHIDSGDAEMVIAVQLYAAAHTFVELRAHGVAYATGFLLMVLFALPPRYDIASHSSNTRICLRYGHLSFERGLGDCGRVHNIVELCALWVACAIGVMLMVLLVLPLRYDIVSYSGRRELPPEFRTSACWSGATRPPHDVGLQDAVLLPFIAVCGVLIYAAYLFQLVLIMMSACLCFRRPQPHGPLADGRLHHERHAPAQPGPLSRGAVMDESAKQAAG